MRSIRYLVIFFLPFCLANGLYSAALSEQEARLEAVQILKLMNQSLYALEQGYSEQHAKPHDPTWVSGKIVAMGQIDLLLRRVMMENVMGKNWPNSIRRAFVEYFINWNADPNRPETFGFLQINDLYQYRYLKQLMMSSAALSPYGGWPAISGFGREIEYYAFLVAQHGQPYDKDWQSRILIPRLKELSAMGESCEVAYLWLLNPEPHNLDEMARLMELNGGLWSQTIKEVSRYQRFVLELPTIMQAPQVAPLVPVRR